MLRATLLAATIAGISSLPILAQTTVPAPLEDYKAHEVVEAFTGEAKLIGLTDQQLTRLDSLHIAVRDERHRWSSVSGNKAHQGVRMRPMISRVEAYNTALGILTPVQQEAIVRRFGESDFVPMLPSLVSELPSSLESLKPHEIVQVFIIQSGALSLDENQVGDLRSLHGLVRDEPHRYSTMTPGSQRTGHRMMEPMISRRRAYNDALSYLSPEQQERAVRHFNAAGYKPPALPEVGAR
jgi:hypothetical protein